MRIVGVLAIVLTTSIAAATTDYYEITTRRIAAWGSGSDGPFIIEMTAYTPEADGANTARWWSIQQPLGVEQATLSDAYTRTPKVAAKSTSTIAADRLEALRARLAELAVAKTKPAQVWSSLENGTTVLRGARCPKEIRVRAGAKRLILWSGKTPRDLGPSKVTDKLTVDLRGEVGRNINQVECFAHAAGWIVRYRVHQGCMGDRFEDRFEYVTRP